MTETSIWDKISTESCRLMRGALIPPKEYIPELRTEITVDCGGTARYSGSALFSRLRRIYARSKVVPR